MGQEIFYGLGAVVLLIALIYGVLQYCNRDRAAVRRGDEVVADRYRRDET